MKEQTSSSINVVTYARCTTKRQSDAAYSIENQSQELENYCLRNNFRVLASFLDTGSSGDRRARPGLCAAIRFCRQNRERTHRFVTKDLSRLSRVSPDLFQILDEFQDMDIDVEVID